MSGIGGVIDFKHDVTNQKPIFFEMIKTLKHRGSYDEGLYTSTHAALLHTRFYATDSENGQQPAFYINCTKQKYVLVYDGELLNSAELRKTLTHAGYTFKTKNDTEVILIAYDYWGKDCVKYLNGSFAFVIYNDQSEQVFLARDPFGGKPLFYTLVQGCLIFASEIKGILAHPLVDAKIDVNSIAELILLGPGKTPGSAVFKDIYELKPGERATFNQGNWCSDSYYQLKDQSFEDSEAQAIEKLKKMVIHSIEKQCESDVPIGCFLSGGLDSSCIASIANQYMHSKGKKLKTFSVDYVDNEKYFKPSYFQPNSDQAYIKKMVKYLDSEHHYIVLNHQDLIHCLNEAVEARDLPGMADIDSSLYLFAKEVKKKVDVVLSGECADEIFGGYPWYRDEEIRNFDGFPWARSLDYQASFLTDYWQQKININAFVDSRYRDTLKKTHCLKGIDDTNKRIKEMMNLNLNWFMQTLVDRSDRMGMANSLLIRTPLCERNIIEYSYAMPWSLKFYKNKEKGILRKAVEDFLPEEVCWRKKSPYPKTHHPKYLKALQIMLKDMLEKDEPIWQIIKREKAEELLHEDNPQPWYGQLMTTPQTIAYFLQINYWLKKYNVKIIE